MFIKSLKLTVYCYSERKFGVLNKMQNNQPSEQPNLYQLQRIEQPEIDEIIRKHQMFLTGRTGGARAVVRDSDLTGIDFSGKNLSQSDFTGSVMTHANLSNANFESATLFGCELKHAQMQGVRLVRADMRGSDIECADLTGADLTGADLREGKTILKRKMKKADDQYGKAEAGAVQFSRSVLSGATLTGATATGANFSDTIMTNVRMQGINLKNAILCHADMSGADLSNADLRNANFRGAILTGSKMDHAEKSGTDFTFTLTNAVVGTDFEETPLSLDELILKHTAWVASAGREGKQLDLTDFDMRKLSSLSGQRLTAVRAIRTTFAGIDMRSVEMQGAVLDQSDFRKCDISNSDMRGSSFKGAVFDRADLVRTNLLPLSFKKKDGTEMRVGCVFDGGSFRHANLQEARLMMASFKNADLSFSSLAGADLRQVDFRGAVLEDTDLSGALLDGALFDD